MIDKSCLDNIIIGRVEPRIYAFTTNTIPNYLKVGDTYRPVSTRLDEWRVHFPELEKQYEGTARINDDVYFRDYAVHQFLETDKQRARLTPTDIPAGVYYSREFFKDANSEDIQAAIADIEKDFSDNAEKYQFYNAENRLAETFTLARTETFSPRPNQEKTIKAFRQAIDSGRKNLLMYAVMRFGKSFTSMCCAAEMDAKLVVIVSAKADVKMEWKKTVESHVKFADYVFLTSDELNRNNKIITETLSNGKKVAVFLTLQDLQGDTIKDKHQEVFGQDIDLLLVDETHFGARADKYGAVLKGEKYEKDVKNKKDADDFIDVEEADETIKTLHTNITIHLSGTPYRILMGSEFKKEDIIAFYQFIDIVHDQEAWDKEHVLDDDYKEWDNPYFGFPQMVRFAFNPNESSRKRLEELKKSGMTYAFSALFKPMSIKKNESGLHKKFKYEREILDLLEVIDGSKADDQLLGFLNYDKIKDGKMCRHIVIVLPYCASCDALETLIAANTDRFRNLNGYKIINISGVDNPNAYKTPNAIKAAVRVAEKNGQKTITLTVNRMLTGSTVPEWDTMLYLKDTASPQEYDQAIFRLQNQYIKTYVDDNGDTIKYNMKPQTLLVDFMPNRMFVMQETKSKIYNANVDTGGNRELEKRIIEELRISPIVTINTDKIVEVKAADILQVVSNYKKDKGIKDEALETPVDLSILEDATIRAAIEQENEIGSKAGLSTPAHDGTDGNEGNDLNTPDGGTPDPDAEETEDTAPHDNAPSSPDDTRKQEISNKKKIQGFYVRILLFAYITKDRVISVSDIIEKMETEDNKRIAYNLGLKKEILVLLYQKSNKFVLSDLDYKIQDLNDLSQASDMSPEDRAAVAVKKFGKLGDAIVITPSNICDDMVNLFSDDFLKEVAERRGRILDIAGTSGEYALALQKRLLSLGIDRQVVADMIYTIPKSSICYELTRKLYEMLGLNGANIAKRFIATDLLDVKTDDEIDYEKIAKIIAQSKPFDEIKLTDDPTQGEADMIQFDAVVGNPPYQEDDGGAQKSAKPIYNAFVKVGKKLQPEYLSIIMPTRWYAGGKGLDEFRDEMLRDKHIKELHDFLHPEEVFPDTNNRGGICYFARNKSFDNSQVGVTIVTHEGEGKTHISQRSLKTRDLDIFIRDSRAISILDKVLPQEQTLDTFERHISAAKAFGFRTFFINDSKFRAEPIGLKNPVKCYGRSGKEGYVDYSEISTHKEWVKLWKVYIPESNNIGTELNDDNQNAFVGSPNTVCTETFLVVGADLNLDENKATNLCNYLKTKFARYLLSLAKISQHGTAKTYRFVSVQDFSRAWADADLYAKYNLDESEIAFIESMIKPME